MNVITPSWETLPQEIWLNIFERMPLKAQVSLGCTCQKLYKLSLDHFLANAEERAWLYLNKETPLPPLLASSIRVFLVPAKRYPPVLEQDLRFAEGVKKEKALMKLVEEQLGRMEGLRKLRIAGNQRTKLWGISVSEAYELVTTKNLEEFQAPVSFFTYKDQKGWSLLHLAVSQGNHKLVSSILSQLEKDLVDVEGYDIGAGGGTMIFIDRETLINSRDEQGKTPLQIALERGDREMMLLLLQKGCKSHTYALTQENTDLSFLKTIPYGSHLDVDFLIDIPAFFQVLEENRTLLSIRFSASFFKEFSSSITQEEDAAERKIEWHKRVSFFRDLAEVLKENKELLILDVREYSRMQMGNEPNFSGEELKPLLACQELEEVWLPPFLLHYSDASGQTPLHWAVVAANKKMVQSLIAQGVPLSSKDDRGYTPYDLAQTFSDERREIQMLLQQARHKKLSVAFGKKEWERYFGSIGVEPPLPADILEILESSCPIWGESQPEKRVIDTHILVLVPEEVNERSLNLDYLQELIQHPKREGNRADYYDDYDGHNEGEEGELGDKIVESSHWVLMTKDVVPGIRGHYWEVWEEVQKRFEHSLRFKAAHYEPPHMLDAAVCILMEYVRSGTRLYTDAPTVHSRYGQYTNCVEGSSRGGGQGMIGDFSFSNIRIGFFRDADGDGLALVRIFSESDTTP